MMQGPRPLDAAVWGLSRVYLPGLLSLFHHAWVCALRAVGGLTHLEWIVHVSPGSRLLDCSPSLCFYRVGRDLAVRTSWRDSHLLNLTPYLGVLGGSEELRWEEPLLWPCVLGRY